MATAEARRVNRWAKTLIKTRIPVWRLNPAGKYPQLQTYFFYTKPHGFQWLMPLEMSTAKAVTRNIQLNGTIFGQD